MNRDPREEMLRTTSREQQLEEKSLLGSSYSYQDGTIEVGPMAAKDLAETDDD